MANTLRKSQPCFGRVHGRSSCGSGLLDTCLQLQRKVGDGWLSWYRACLLRQLSGYESSHLSKIQNGRYKQRNGQHTTEKIFFVLLVQSMHAVATADPYRLSEIKILFVLLLLHSHFFPPPLLPASIS
jgi:hypothetical protein